MDPSSDRAPKHRRNDELEALLTFFETRLGPTERAEIEKVEKVDEPLLFIMGCARSGTTVVLQYLAATGLFTYPSNFVSRFPYAPYLGAKLQRMLIETDSRGEIFGDGPDEPFASNLGKTRGARSPHEFWYFWRRFFSFGEEQKLDPEALAAVDRDLFLSEWRAFQSVAGLPLVAKGMICNWHIPFLAGIDPGIQFLYVERDAASNADSLLRAREEFFGDPGKWYSFRPPGYRTVLSASPEEQVAWQVEETNRAIREGLDQVDAERIFRVRYEDFCSDPGALLGEITGRWGLRWNPEQTMVPDRFSARRRT